MKIKPVVFYHSMVALVFLCFWALIVVIEVKIKNFLFLKYLFLGSLPLVFAAFWLAGVRSLRSPGFAVASSLLISPVFILVGVSAILRLKLLIGGHI